MRTEEGVGWVLGVEIYELSTYHFPHIEVSTFLYEACKKLIHGVWYEKSLLHGSFGSLHRSSLTCAFAVSRIPRDLTNGRPSFAAMLISSARG
jgi:hypothetical protein